MQSVCYFYETVHYKKYFLRKVQEMLTKSKKKSEKDDVKVGKNQKMMISNWKILYKYLVQQPSVRGPCRKSNFNICPQRK